MKNNNSNRKPSDPKRIADSNPTPKTEKLRIEIHRKGGVIISNESAGPSGSPKKPK